MAALNDPRRASYAAPPGKTTNPAMAEFESSRKPSLKEMPSYRDEASRALNRREDVNGIKDRLSASKEMLNADPSTKPWLRRTSGSSAVAPARRRESNLDRVSEDSHNLAGRTSFSSPANSAMGGSAIELDLRTRHRSRSTTTSSEGSFNSDNYFEFWPFATKRNMMLKRPAIIGVIFCTLPSYRKVIERDKRDKNVMNDMWSKNWYLANSR